MTSELKAIWRVAWNLAGTNTRQSLEFSSEQPAMVWAQGLLEGGANGITVTELMIGKVIQIEPDRFLFP